MTKQELLMKLKAMEERSLAVIAAYKAQHNCQVSLLLRGALMRMEQELNRPLSDPMEQQIQKYLEAKHTVFINYNDEAGIKQYSVQVSGTDFWLNSFPTLQKAKDYIKKHGLYEGACRDNCHKD